MGVLLNEEVNMNQQCVLTTQEANCVLNFIKSNVARRSTPLSRAPIWTALSNSGIPNRRRKWSEYKEGIKKVIMRLEHLCYEESWGY